MGLAFVILAPQGAFAGLEVCNDSDSQQSVSLGYQDADGWTSQGWWNIDAGACLTLLGGDLKYRYYYVRAESNGRTFVDENFVFCTERSAFKIAGDKDCTARGFERSKFRRIDTGTSAKQFTYVVTDAVSLVAAAPKAAPEKTAEPSAVGVGFPGTKPPGTWGESYVSDTAIFQDCDYEGDMQYCMFHDGGTKFYVYADGRTPGALFRVFEGYLPGQPVEIHGDLEEIYDRSADMVLRWVDTRSPYRWDNILAQLQGGWYAVDDPASMVNILGSEWENYLDGDLVDIEYLSLRSTCDYFDGGEYLVRLIEETGETLCYSIENVDDFGMTLMYLPSAAFHEFRRLN